MPKTQWEKPYCGPFKKKEAEEIAKGLREIAKPEINSIHDARVRARRGGKLYDVYIKTTCLE